MEAIAKVRADRDLALRIAARRAEQGLSRFDVYFHEDRSTAVVIAAGRAAAVCALAEKLAGTIEPAAASIELLADRAEALPAEGRRLTFAFGLEARPARRCPSGIEIVTRFRIAEGKEDAFRSIAGRLTDLVRAADPGTARYDWFFSDDGRVCIALDTYRDTAGMLAHMGNAHELHERLLELAVMATEFLGHLPADALAAVAKYDPFVLPRLVADGA